MALYVSFLLLLHSFILLLHKLTCTILLAITLCARFAWKLPVSLHRTSNTIRLLIRALALLGWAVFFCCCWRYFKHLWRAFFKKKNDTPMHGKKVPLTRPFQCDVHLPQHTRNGCGVDANLNMKHTTYHNVNIQFYKIIAINRLLCCMVLDSVQRFQTKIMRTFLFTTETIMLHIDTNTHTLYNVHITNN